jgi:hypothetical protein
MSRIATAILLAQAWACSSIDGQVIVSGGTFSPVAVRLSGPVSGTTQAASSGAFHFGGLVDGDYRLMATMPSTVEGTSVVHVTIDASHPAPRVNLELHGAGSISGEVTATQNPQEGLTVTIVDTGQQTTTAVDGTFSFPVVAVGTHWLSIPLASYPTIVTQPFQVSFGVETKLPIIDFEQDLTRAGALRGNVTVRGVGPATASLRLDGGGSLPQFTMTDANGNFGFPQLAVTTYTLTITVPDTVEGTQKLQNIPVGEDAVTDLGTIAFTPAGG